MKLRMKGARIFVLLGFAGLLSQQPAAAQLALQTVKQGSYAFNSSYPLTPALHQPTLSSLSRSSADAAERNIVAGYVSFELPAFDRSITSAVLTLNYSGAFRSGGETGPIRLNAWDVETALDMLSDGPFGIPVPSGPGHDLQSGQLYGFGEIEPGVFQMRTISVSLGATLLEQVNELPAGGTLTVGLALSPALTAEELSLQLLTVQPGDAHIQLHLEFGDGGFTPVPEASTYGLAGLLLGFAAIWRRRFFAGNRRCSIDGTASD